MEISYGGPVGHREGLIFYSENDLKLFLIKVEEEVLRPAVLEKNSTGNECEGVQACNYDFRFMAVEF